jgi:hypothetical protein
MGEYGGELGRPQQVERADADHDLGANAGQAVGGRRRVVDDERARHLGVAVREQRQKFPLPAPRADRVGERHDEHPAQQGEEGKAGYERGQPGDREYHRLMRGYQFAGL